jgi:hypothetical protein
MLVLPAPEGARSERHAGAAAGVGVVRLSGTHRHHGLAHADRQGLAADAGVPTDHGGRPEGTTRLLGLPLIQQKVNLVILGTRAHGGGLGAASGGNEGCRRESDDDHELHKHLTHYRLFSTRFVHELYVGSILSV